MDSYTGFAERFDLLIDWDRRRKREETFFRRVLPEKAKSVLDCHCGTGFHCAMLSEMGYYTEGVDCSEDMLRVAVRNLEARGLSVRLHKADVKEMQSVLDRKFDCVLSMGNSLPHEPTDDCLLKALASMRQALVPGGICIIHMEDYDALYKDHDRFIPSTYRRHQNGAEAFIFAIDYFQDQVVFNILSIIEREGNAEFHADVVKYNPVSVKKMERLIQEAGFTDLAIYCDFRLTPHGMRESYDVIFVAYAPA
ncbi:class I SAM-dependent DNA methyltransferase [Methanocella arvoryzae]|uniref:Predicted SAM-dependent methyltransferase n=1 Tax=Methanocella arvoryzae (strain DSM 22066 / NBRC 105507 / MRE50) TaxID=351160 RepID=Q0W270_METAR|nr:class I SAM-dependent methyltransferase [Methanocella arvoryzae]CAJ37523.1 predicted SAM-dependent methyltransferase [Methanocella arvoryzae MRE50]